MKEKEGQNEGWLPSVLAVIAFLPYGGLVALAGERWPFAAALVVFLFWFRMTVGNWKK